MWHIASHCRFPADPDACSALDAPHPTKNIQRSPAGRDRSTGADSSLCNKSGSSSTLKRLVCASGGRRTMANSMLHDAAYPLLSVPVASNYLKVYWVWRFIDFHPHNPGGHSRGGRQRRTRQAYGTQRPSLPHVLSNRSRERREPGGGHQKPRENIVSAITASAVAQNAAVQ